MVYDLIIIGGGASGLACAYAAVKRGKSVLVLEREKKVGTKLLMTGNGKCNLSATDVCPEKYNHPNFVKDILEQEDVHKFIADIGIMTRTVDRRIYPYSESALTVVNKLRSALPPDVIRTEEVERIDKKELFVVNGYSSRAVVICTGSAATKGKASYDLAERFGHKTTELMPSLVPLVTDTTYIKGLSGLRNKVRLKLIKGEKTVAQEEGEILFRDNGISGICSMCLSTYIARHPGKYVVSINFVPDVDAIEYCKEDEADGILHQAVAQAVSKYASTKKVPLVSALTDFRLDNVACGGLKQAQVVCGGLITDDFDDRLQSKICPGLYAGGEVLDVDGECGGYNLHWAFASGLRIGNSV